MRCRRLALVFALSLPLATVSTVAARIAGGGKPTSDRYSEFDGVTATTPPFTLECRDGRHCQNVWIGAWP